MVTEQEFTGAEAGLSGENQIRLALQAIIAKGGEANIREIYESVEAHLPRPLSDQGQATLRRLINTDAVDDGLIEPFDKERPGWKKVDVSLPLERTALISMHVWQFASREEIPGLYSGHPYIPAADRIVAEVFPPLLSAARSAGMPVVHVVGGKDYWSHLSGYQQTVELAGPEPEPPEGAPPDPDGVGAIRELKRNEGYPGAENLADIQHGNKEMTIPGGALPVEGEYIAATTHQLNAVCRKLGVSHLIYMGFNTNWCILMSPCGMLDMSRLGYLCSLIRQATNAVENKESARGEKNKEEALWRTSVGFGIVFDADPIVAALEGAQ